MLLQAKVEFVLAICRVSIQGGRVRVGNGHTPNALCSECTVPNVIDIIVFTAHRNQLRTLVFGCLLIPCRFSRCCHVLVDIVIGLMSVLYQTGCFYVVIR